MSKTKIKLIASDFDGTIGDGDQTALDAEAIGKWRAAGNLFGFVSGRNAAALRWVQENAGIDVDFLLSDSGNVCYMGKKLFFCFYAPQVLFHPLADFMMSRGTKLLAVNRVDGADMLYYRHSDGREEYDPRRAFWQERPFPQVSGYFETAERCHEVAAELESIFPRLTALPNWSCLDIVPKGSGKDAGVKRLAEALSVPLENVYTVGDNYNDIPMLDAFNSFVVSSACPEVQAHATVAVVPSVAVMIASLM